jgi:outer membrane protein assembly factor BamB
MSLTRRSCLRTIVTAALVLLLAKLSTAADKEPPLKELDAPWSLEGSWRGVVADDEEQAIYALNQKGECVELDAMGQVRREFMLPDAGGSVLRFAGWSKEEGRALLTFTTWSRELRAYDLEGAFLWTCPRASGIDDVWAANLDGEKPAAVIVGFNGGTGLKVLDRDGQLRWKTTAIGNVWHVCAGDVWGDGTTQVVTTSAAGQVHVFSSDGKKRKDLSAGIYANMVRVGKLSDKDKSATIFVAGSSPTAAPEKGEALVALSGEGKKKWSLDLPAGGTPHADSAALSAKWLAVGMRGGLVHVIDAEKGAIVSSVEEQGGFPEVAWLAADKAKDGKRGSNRDTPLLLVATQAALNAFGLPSGK